MPPSPVASFGPGKMRETSFPVERAFSPLVDEADDEDAEEQHHGQVAKHSDLAEHHAPREQKGNLKIEDDEQDGDQVLAHVETHARILEGLEAALIGRELFTIWISRRQQESGRDRDQAKADAHGHEN